MHRDMKTENILLHLREGAAEEDVLLTDFGLSKEVDTSTAEAETKVRTENRLQNFLEPNLIVVNNISRKHQNKTTNDISISSAVSF